MPIHPTALVDPRAILHETVEVGPFAVIEGSVRIGARTRLLARAHILGDTVLGEENVVHMNAVIGHEPQIIPYDGKARATRIGNRNVFREGVSIHCASKDEGATIIGDDCFFMANSHVGHDCHIGNRVILANGALIGGHVEIQDFAFISGNCTIHQFVRIGRYVMFQGLSGAGKDIIPFMLAADKNAVAGLNVVGLRRAGFGRQELGEIKAAFKTIFTQHKSLPRAIEELKAGDFGDKVKEIIAFCEAPTKRGVCNTYAGDQSGEE